MRRSAPRAVERGSVEHLTTQHRRYFTDIVDLVSFLTAYTPKNGTDERVRDR